VQKNISDRIQGALQDLPINGSKNEEFFRIRMPGQKLRLYNILAKVNERADGHSCSTRFVSGAPVRANRRAVNRRLVAATLYSLAAACYHSLNCFSVVGRNYDG
jgi:hypothetical protein